jgi:hypothetical protein
MSIENFKQYNNSANFSDNTIYFSGFVDERNGLNIEGRFKYLIPFIFFGSTDMSFPEYDILSPGTDINLYFYHGIRDSLKEKNERLNLVYLKSSDINQKKKVLSGNLKEYKCQRNQYLYGLSILGVFLYYFGFPIISYECHVGINLNYKSNQKVQEKYFDKKYNTYTSIFKDIHMTKNLHMKIVKDVSLVAEEMINSTN